MGDLRGNERRDVVDRLMKEFDAARALEEPRWVSLTASTGWGKTRLVQEFYKALASHRQQSGQYWPPTVFEDREGESILATRKRVDSAFDHATRSLPGYLWWGITCTDSDSPVGDFVTALSTLTAHAPYLEQAWIDRVSPAQRAARALEGLRREVLAEGGSEFIASALEASSGVEPVGLGLAWWLGSRLDELAAARRSARKRFVAEEHIAPDFEAEVVEALAMVGRLGRAGIATVVTVEDGQLMDAATASFLGKAVTLNVPVLIVTTQTEVSQGSPLLEAMWSREDRVMEIAASGTPSTPFRRVAEVPDLGAEDRASIAADWFGPEAIELCTAIANRYSNPLALSLFCTLPRHRLVDGSATSPPTASEVESAPLSVRDMYREVWRHLDERSRAALHLAAQLSSYGTASRFGAERTWSPRWVARAAAMTGVLDEDDFVTALEGTIGSWTSRRGDLMSTIERDQFDVALQDTDLISEEALLSARRELAKLLNIFFAQDRQLDRTTWSLSQTAIALHATGHPISQEVLARTGMTVVLELVGSGSSPAQAMRIAHHLVDQLRGSDFEVASQLALSRALAGAGRPDEAAAVLKAVVARSDLLDHLRLEEAIVVRADLASALYESGRHAEATAILEELVGLEPPAAITEPMAVHLRLHLAAARRAAGSHVAALADIDALLGSALFDRAADDHLRLAALGNRADVLLDLGRVTEGLALRDEVAAGFEGWLGAEHPLTLLARSNAAGSRALYDDRYRGKAIAELRRLVALRSRLSGFLSPAAIGTRSNLADALTADGQDFAALVEHRRVVAESTRVLGLAHPLTLSRRNNLALAMIDDGHIHAAIPMLEAVVADLFKVLGPEHPHTQRSRRSLADAREVLRERRVARTDAFGLSRSRRTTAG